MKRTLFIAAFASLSAFAGTVSAAGSELTNASFDISRELFADINQSFVAHYKAKAGKDLTIHQSHAGSTKQANSILEGLEADVVTFNQVNDVLLLVKGGLIGEDWASRHPGKASPFVSVHGILVRKGNPKGIKDWSDLAKEGVEIVQVNPKTGGNGRYAVLAYYTAALSRGADEAAAKAFLRDVLGNVIVFDQGGRAATTTFTERATGDVLVTFESEALALAAAEPDKYEAVIPTSSVASSFPVAVVDKVASRRGTTELANAYLAYLYEEEAQEIIARNFYRPSNAAVAARFEKVLPPLKQIDVEEAIAPWSEVNASFFGTGGLVDKIVAEIGKSL